MGDLSNHGQEILDGIKWRKQPEHKAYALTALH